jgi:ferric-dicitrate binding protein FerR (iron transport regulator)
MPEKHTIEEIIVHYLQQDCSDEELCKLDTWMQESEENKDSLFQFKQIVDLTRSRRILSEEDIHKSWQRMEEKLLGAPPGARPKKVHLRGRLVSWMKYAALGGVALWAGLLIGRQGGLSPREAEEPQASFHELSVRKGTKLTTLALPDGTLVSLNAAGRLRYPSRFDGGVREVYLEGEAFFNVAPMTESRFIVRLRKQNILVHGTHFNVEAYPDEPYSLVTLLSGRLTVETRNKMGDTIGHTLLRPGQKACFDRLSETVSVEQADTLISNAWMGGEYKFRNERLELIVKRLENYYDVAFHWENEQARDVRYTGTFSLDQDIESILRVINHQKQFVFRRSGKDIYIR